MGHTRTFSLRTAVFGALGAAALIAPAIAYGAAVAGPSFAAASVLKTGAPDSGFGSGGQKRFILAAGYCGYAQVENVALRGSKTVFAGICGAYGDWQGGAVAVRADATGAVDTTFNGNGATRMAGITPYAVAIDSSNRVLIAGESNNHFALGRFTAAGAVDTGFGTNGIVETNIPGISGEEAHSIALQSDGKIVVAGDGEISAGSVVFAVARYTSSGALDTTFTGNDDGMAVLDMTSSTTEEQRSLAIAPNGKIVLAGSANLNGTPRQFAVVVLKADGSWDTSFAGSGKKIIDIPNAGPDTGYAVGVDSQNRIVVGGMSAYSTYEYVVIRLTTAGALDSSFGSGGVVHTNFATSTGEAVFDLKVLSSAAGSQYLDRIVVAGDATVSGANQLSAARYLTNGQLDTSYDADGKVLVDIAGQTDEQALGLAIDPSTARAVLVTP